MLTIRESFIEVKAADSKLWLSSLFIQLEGGRDRSVSTFLGFHGGDLFLTGATLIGDGNNCRAILVSEGHAVFAYGAQLHLFLL